MTHHSLKGRRKKEREREREEEGERLLDSFSLVLSELSFMRFPLPSYTHAHTEP
jgi:hypothetical protein